MTIALRYRNFFDENPEYDAAETESVKLLVSDRLYRNIFLTEFNVSFGYPTSDIQVKNVNDSQCKKMVFLEELGMSFACDLPVRLLEARQRGS